MMKVFSEFDIYTIVKELDYKTGMDFRYLDIEIEEDLLEENLLAYCEKEIITREEYLERVYKRYNSTEDEESKDLFKEIIDRVEQSDLDKLYNPLAFRFSPIVLYLPYEELRENVIHEYAHALYDVRCAINFRRREEDSHGKMFQNTVRELGGSSIHAFAEQNNGYNAEVYRRAEQMARDSEMWGNVGK